MLIQLHLNPTDARAAKAYRLQVKERLYRFNYVSCLMILLRARGQLVLMNMGLTGFVYPGSACSARGEGPLREARRDFSKRLRRLSENIGDVAVMWVSFTDEFRVAVYSHGVVCRVKCHARCPGHGHFFYYLNKRCEVT